MKNFNQLIEDLIYEQPDPAMDPAAAPPLDPAAVPVAPGAGEQPDASPEQAALSPAAEVTLVRLLLKALVINIEDSDLSTLTKIDHPEINAENAEQVKRDVVSVINAQQTRGENEDRVDSIRELMLGINEKNSKSMLNKFVSLMKQYSDVNITDV